MELSKKLLCTIGALVIVALLFLPQPVHAKRGMPEYVVEKSCGQENADGTTVLIAFATNYGRTYKIAEAISETLCADGYRVDIRFAKNLSEEELTEYDAVILGSCIYIEEWHPDALAFLKKYQATLAQKKVAYYCVCALMGMDFENAATLVDEHYILPMYERFPDITPLDVTAFAGAINYRILLPKDWLMLRLMFMPGGDWTDWDAVFAWADKISTLLR
jgi:menaquinone-dependent protoporphyrinogen oxidase